MSDFLLSLKGYIAKPEHSNSSNSLMKSTSLFDRLKGFFLSNPKIISRIFFTVLIAITVFVIYQRYEYLKAVEKTNANNLLKVVEKSIEQSINSALLATTTLALSVNDEGLPVGFEELGKQLVDNNNFLDGIQLVPDGIIKYVYPFEKNKPVLNYNILEDQKTNKEAFNAINKKKFYIAGPFELKQGGLAVVCRLPIFRKNKFWGFSAVLIYFETLIRNAGIDTSGKSGYHFQFSKVNPNTLIEEKFLPVRAGSQTEYIASIDFQESNWKISIMTANKHQLLYGLYIMAGICLLAAWALSVLLHNILSRPAMLEKLVRQRTLELENSDKTIRKNEILFQTLTSNAPVAIFQTNMKGECIYVNEEWMKYAGMELEEALGYGWSNAIHPEDKERVLDEWQAAISSGNEFKTEVRFQNKNGKTTWLSAKAVALYDSGKKIYGYIGMALDISDRKLSEENMIRLNKELELRVKERTRELEKANSDLQDINDIFIGNEIKVYEMKKELATLKKKLEK